MWGVITPRDRILTWAKQSTSIHFSLLPNRGCDVNSHLVLLSLWLPHSDGCTSNCSQRNSFLPPQGTVVQGFVTRTRQIAKCKGISSDGEVISYFQVRRQFAGVTRICLQFQRPGIWTQSVKTTRDFISKTTETKQILHAESTIRWSHRTWRNCPITVLLCARMWCLFPWLVRLPTCLATGRKVTWNQVLYLCFIPKCTLQPAVHEASHLDVMFPEDIEVRCPAPLSSAHNATWV